VGRLGFRVGVSASYSYNIISFQFLPITGVIAFPAAILECCIGANSADLSRFAAKFEDDSAISVLHRR